MWLKFFVTIFLIAAAQMAYAEYDSRCLSNCFGTGHDCNYCAYMCYYDFYTRSSKEYTFTDSPCEIGTDEVT